MPEPNGRVSLAREKSSTKELVDPHRLRPMRSLHGLETYMHRRPRIPRTIHKRNVARERCPQRSLGQATLREKEVWRARERERHRGAGEGRGDGKERRGSDGGRGNEARAKSWRGIEVISALRRRVTIASARWVIPLSIDNGEQRA